MTGRRWRLAALAAGAVVAVLLLALLAAHLSVYRVVGRSMVPSYAAGDVLLVESVTFRLRRPRRFEVVVVRDPTDPGRLELKRLVGLPGETVAAEDGRLLIGGVKYALPAGVEAPARFGPVQTAAGYFVLGDNWRQSRDSRHYGALGEQLVLGRPAVRLYHTDD